MRWKAFYFDTIVRSLLLSAGKCLCVAKKNIDPDGLEVGLSTE